MNSPYDFWQNLRQHSKPESTEYVSPILYSLAKYMNAKTTAEIGTMTGFVTIPLGMAMKENGGKHYAIEIRAENIEKTEANCQKYGIDVEFIHGDSVKIDWKHKLDLLFVDGDHSEHQVIKEIKKYWAFINKNGLMCFHDFLKPIHVEKALTGSSTRSEREQAEVINFPYDSGLTIWRKM